MKFLFFLVIIPALAGAISTAFGFSPFNSDTLMFYFAINLPICVLSSAIFAFTD